MGLQRHILCIKKGLKRSNRSWSIKFSPKSVFDSLKAEVDKLDIDELKAVPTNLIALSSVVDRDVLKRDVHDKLIAKVDTKVD